MKTTIALLTLGVFLCNDSYGAPATSVTDAVLLGEIDIMTNEDIEISTEEPVPKKCNFRETTYAHGQTIPTTNDPCSHCLCVAGEVYCWWQDCLFHSSSSSSSLSSSSSSINDFDNNKIDENYMKSITTSFDTTSGYNINSNSTLFGINDDNNNNNNNNNNTTSFITTETGLDDVQFIEEDGYIIDLNTTYQDYNIQSTTTPTSCVVMGIEYKEGEALPHSTGNCVQCGCGTGGRVECSPQDCVPLLQPPSGAGVDLSRGMDEIF